MKSLKKDWAERLLSRSTCKKVRVTTEPISNTGQTQWFAHFYEVRKILWILPWTEKMNQNNKLLLCAWRKGLRLSAPALHIVCQEAATAIKWLHAVNKMMVGPSGSLYRRWP